MRQFTFIACAILLATGAQAAETTSRPWTVYEAWPFNTAEAKRRQEETAMALGIPVKKTITIGTNTSGKPVTVDFMLIPAGTFVIGTPDPKPPILPTMPPDDSWIGGVLMSIGMGVILPQLVLMIFRSIRENRWPRFSLRGLLLALFAVSAMAMGVSLYQDEKSLHPKLR